ncbi:DUF1992 domain-containing protein [Nocardioides sp.]|uniref:DnaJ family domain-containing protein n=1 Tax=Nocardioides sp. TaxID=35761 RepID=UPI00273261A9|nr:DUF1992 domain-containing protein [Nocardioides sp.]
MQPDHDETPPAPDRGTARDARTGGSAAAARIQHQTQWVDLQLQQAMARGDFDDLPGLGKPIEDLGAEHDPDWWVKKLVEREQVTGVLPPALQLRKDDAGLAARLDRISTETEVRRELEDFNDRVRRALYQPLGGPPLITRQRDVEAEVSAWRQRRAERRARQQGQRAEPPAAPVGRRRWWSPRWFPHVFPGRRRGG